MIRRGRSSVLAGYLVGGIGGELVFPTGPAPAGEELTMVPKSRLGLREFTTFSRSGEAGSLIVNTEINLRLWTIM